MRLNGPNTPDFSGFCALPGASRPAKGAANRKRSDGQIEVPFEVEIRLQTEARPQPDAQTLTRIANALERLAPRPNAEADFAAADAFIWQPQGSRKARDLRRCRASTGSR